MCVSFITGKLLLPSPGRVKLTSSANVWNNKAGGFTAVRCCLVLLELTAAL